MKSSYQLRNITTRTVWADGTDVLDGPPVNTTYPLGYFREDYEYIARAGQPDYLDIHNGRICKTPEYPNGIYCYFATVDAKHNSSYPYVVGPTYYGVRNAAKVANITETVTTYIKTTPVTETNLDNLSIQIFPSPSADLIAVQLGDLVKEDYNIELYTLSDAPMASSLAFFRVDGEIGA